MIPCVVVFQAVTLHDAIGHAHRNSIRWVSAVLATLLFMRQRTKVSVRTHTHYWGLSLSLCIRVVLFLSQSVIQSETPSKQSASLSKHVNPPTSSLFPWTLAAVCSSTLVLSWVHTHMHTEGWIFYLERSERLYDFSSAQCVPSNQWRGTLQWKYTLSFILTLCT